MSKRSATLQKIERENGKRLRPLTPASALSAEESEHLAAEEASIARREAFSRQTGRNSRRYAD